MAQSFTNFKDADSQLLASLYGKADLNFVSGKGSDLEDASGKRYLDFVSGIAVNALGHCHPSIQKAIAEQAEKFMHISNLYPNKPQIDFAEKLLAASGFDKAFFSSALFFFPIDILKSPCYTSDVNKNCSHLGGDTSWKLLQSSFASATRSCNGAFPL